MPAGEDRAVTPERRAGAGEGSPSESWRFGRGLRGRPDTEHEMSFNRLGFALIISVYLLLEAAPGHTLLVVAAYWIVALALFLHILVRPATNIPRRIAALILDMAFLSYELYAGGEVTSVLAPIYLWIILGNGFRFGVAWLRWAQGAAILGFAAVIATTPFWGDQPHLSAGFLLGLVAIPAYAGTLIRKLSAAKLQAEAANQAKSLFLASVSHELRTPLNAIIGMGGLLQQTRMERGQREMLGIVLDAGNNLINLIDKLLDFSRIEAGRMPVTHAAFALPELLDDVQRLLAGQAMQKGLRLTFHVTPRTPHWLVSDRMLVREVLLNLVGNAVKFTAQGSVVVAADAVPVPGGVTLRLEVTDTGIGIAGEAQDRIFEAFSQADASIINRFGGTGLGLAISRRTVALLGGELGLESSVGAGSTFWCELPMAPADAPLDEAPLAEAVLLAHDADARIQRLSDRSQRLRLHPAHSLPEALKVFSAMSDGAPRILIAHAAALAMPPTALALALEVLDPPGVCRNILIAMDQPEGLPPVQLRRAFISVLPEPAESPAQEVQALEAALRLAEGNSQRTALSAEVAPVARRQLSILVADDNRVNLRVVERILQTAGHEAVLVEDGEAALDALAHEDFDLVLMDLNMPRMDGIEAALLYRVQSLGQRQIPWLALTADATDEARRRCEEAGFAGCLVKPFSPDALLAAIERLSAPLEPARIRSPSSEPDARLRTTAGVPVDQGALDALEALGGIEFARGIVEEFLQDAGLILDELALAVKTKDAASFRAKAHAMHSAATHVGARALCDLCAVCRGLGPDMLREEGAAIIDRIAAELQRARPFLLRRTPTSTEHGGGSA